MKMTGRERLLCALNHKEPDTVPIFEWLYSRNFYKEVLDYVPTVFNAECVVPCSAKVGYDFVFIPMGGTAGFTATEQSGDEYTDEWGITYRKAPSAWPIDATIGYPLRNGEDWKKFKMPDPSLPERYESVKTALRLAGEHGMGVVGNVRGPFSAAWLMFGMEDFSYLLYDEPETVHSVLTAMADFVIEGGLRMADLGVDGIIFADDYGSNTQPMMSLPHFRQFIAPQIKRMADAFHKKGVPIIMHSDGCINPLVPDCMAAGIDGIHPLQRNAGMDIAQIKRDHGKQVCIFGNIDNNHLLVEGTPAEVEAQVKECISIAAPGGGYCLGSDHSIHDDIPNENVFAIYEAGRKYGKYPISF